MVATAITQWFWLAVNGSSVAASAVSSSADNVRVKPTPEVLIGFKSRAKQKAIQRMLLEAPIAEVRLYMASLSALAQGGKVCVIRPDKPEPQTEGSTMWMFDPERPPTPEF